MLEYGEYKGYLYGTSIDAVRTVLDAGKICVIDLEPQVSGKGAGTLLDGKIIFSTFLSHWNSVCCFVFSLYLMVLINNRLFFSCVLGGGGGTTVTSMLRQFIFYQASSCIISLDGMEMSFHTYLK